MPHAHRRPSHSRHDPWRVQKGTFWVLTKDGWRPLRGSTCCQSMTVQWMQSQGASEELIHTGPLRRVGFEGLCKIYVCESEHFVVQTKMNQENYSL